jgi:hypothetical protein
MRAAALGCTVLLLVPVALHAQQALSAPIAPGATTTGAPGTNQTTQPENGTLSRSSGRRDRALRCDGDTRTLDVKVVCY